MKEKTYTQEEIDSKINILETDIDSLKAKRTDISKEINSKKKQVLVWSGFDIAQFKMF
tara:strand:- start:214 stop:387 length:174 start_codon:yes stop_codon:yes gene_type:complete